MKGSQLQIHYTISSIVQNSVSFDICSLKNCIWAQNIAGGVSSTFKVLETGGVFIHIERSAAKIDFRSNVFSGCSTTTSPWTPIQHSTNI
ncbi:MAG: hypothetical protein EZS28_045127, partial [Streblomastix strix]